MSTKSSSKSKTAIQFAHSNVLLIYAFSFIIPVIILAFSLLLSNVSPYGTNTILTYDLEYELLPYYSYLSRLGSGFNNLFYCTTQGLGGGFWGIAAFELSPLDLIYFFIPLSFLPQAIYFMILFKIGLSGLFCCVFLSNGKNRISGIWCVTLSCCYALMSYSIIYTSWPVFQDAVMFFPILVLALDKIISGQKSKLFVTTMVICMISCYYTAYMMVIALVLYFVFRVIEDGYDLKTILKRLSCFVIHGLLSVGISVFMLLPVIIDLTRGKLSSDEAIVYSEPVKFNLLSVLCKFIPTSYSNLGNNQLPNIYCSSLILLLALVYLFKKDKIQNKIVGFGIMILYFCSFIFTPLDKVWHGFSNPTGYSCRYAFTFVFFMLCFAARGITSLSGQRFNISSSIKKLIISVAIIYTFAEVTVNASFIISRISDDYAYCTRSEYDMYDEVISGSLAAIDQIADTEFYRLSKNFSFTCADDMLYGYNDVEYIGSSYNGALVRFCRTHGLYSTYAMINSTGLTPPVANLLDVEYYLSYGQDLSEYYQRLGQYSSVDIYHNENALPLGFVINDVPEIRLTDLSSDPFKNINSIYSDIQGTNEALTVFEQCDPEILSFEPSPETGTNILTLKFNSIKKGHYWIFIESKYESDQNITANPQNSGILYYYLDNEYAGMIGEYDRRFCSDIGRIGSNEEHTLTIDLGSSVGANVYLYYLNMDNLNSICSKVNGFDVTENRSSTLHLSGYTEKSESLFISLPYEKGYRIYLNGKKVPYEAYRDTFLLINTDAGQNDIIIKYTPDGFTVGLIISVISIFISLLYFTSRSSQNRSQDACISDI